MPIATRTCPHLFAALAASCALAGCGGGSGGGSTNNPVAPPPSTGSASGWVSGSFLPAASFAGKCVTPRSGADPLTGQPYNEVQGTSTDENNWLRSWSNDLYLWYNEIVDRDPALSTTVEYFRALKTAAITPSGKDKDRFHFTYPSTQWVQLSQSGVEAGYGAAWALVATLPPRRIVVAYTEPGSPASSALPALERGEEVQSVDGTDVVSSNTQAEVDRFVAGLYPDVAGELHTFTLRQPRTGVVRTVQLQSVAVTKTPVRYSTVTTTTGTVGYMLFNDHVATAEQQLVAAFDAMRTARINDLVIDLRYNGGGYLSIASEVAYMIAGSTATAGQTFEKLTFNDKHPAIDPVTGSALTPVPFVSTTRGFSMPAGQPLPTLDLRRVYVLTGASTCSASESIINSLRGINVDVIQIGSTTCGKPYGFYPADHCGTTYFSVQFKGVNAQGFGDYTDGFTPNNSPVVGGTRGSGCSVADDFTNALGSTSEGRFAAALQYRNSLACPVASGNKPGPLSVFPREETDAVVPKSPWFQNRWPDGP
jgi:C-terminal processing protease CtpA/Prc